MRTKRTIINSTFNICSQIVQLLLSFIIRNLFIKYIGIEYLGLNGLFSNILSALNLADLGIGAAITYHLYKPLAINDTRQINGLMRFYKKTYYSIGSVILIIGSILMFFVQYLIKDQTHEISFLRVIFLIQLLGTASTYFLAYKRTLLFADQKNYLAAIIDTSVSIIMMVVRVVTLLIFKSYVIYLVMILVQNILANIIITIICNRVYPYLKYKTEHSPIDKRSIFKNLKNIVVERIVGYIYYSTDNIIISKFVGLASVGLLSNYTLIVGTVQTFFVQITSAVQASLGNLVHSENDTEKVNDIFYKFNFFCFICSSFCVVSFLVLAEPFIELWLGKNYMMPNYIILLLSILFYTSTMRMPLGQMILAYGMFRQMKIISIIGATVNLILSFVLVNYIGVAGTLFGTIICDLIYWFGQAYCVIVKKLNLPYKEYIFKITLFVAITLIECIITIGISNLVISTGNIYSFIIKGGLCIIIPNGINLLLFRKSSEMLYFKKILFAIFKKVFIKNISNDN